MPLSMANELTCKNCGAQGILVGWQIFKNGTKHIRSECPKCHRFCGFLEQTPRHIEYANRPPAEQVRHAG